jgi:hypothetical protein
LEQTANKVIGDISTLEQSVLSNTTEIAALKNTTTGLQTGVASLSNAINSPNILHNWEFINPVNQRGQSQYIGAGRVAYSIDRWQTNMVSSASVTLTANGLQIQNNASSNQQFRQMVENANRLLGRTVTLSIEVSGVIVSASVTLPLSASGQAMVGFSGGFATYATSGLLAINIYPGQIVVIQRVKLELGEVSTLANDPPMDYTNEFQVCQWYYRRIVPMQPMFNFNTSTPNRATIRVPITPPMRINPTTRLIGTQNSVNGYYMGTKNGGNIISGVEWTAVSVNNILCVVQTNHPSISNDQFIYVFDRGSCIELDADL